MKTNLFNFKRVGLLFQRYFSERFRTELIYWGIMAIVFMLIQSTPSLLTLILVAGAFYSARFSREIHSPNNGIAYFMIPATHLEKLTVTIVITTFYYFVMMMMVYAIGNMAGTLLNNMLADMDFFPNALFHHSSLQWKLFEDVTFGFSKTSDMGRIPYIVWIFRLFLMSQPLFLLGGIYFKKNQAFKTFAAIILIQLLISTLLYIEAKLILGDSIRNIPDIAIKWNLNMVATIVQIFYVLLSLFFWVVSYFRLTEKQV